MKIKAKQAQKRNNDSGGKKRPFQDDTALILAIMIVMIVGHAYVISKMQQAPAKQKIVFTAQSSDMSDAIGQNLSAQRQTIEERVTNILAIPAGGITDAMQAALRPTFSESGWAGYQQYLAERQAQMATGAALKTEFVFGSQRYATSTDGRTAFKAEGVYCLGGGADYRCGPQRFIIQLVMSGNIKHPEALSFDAWQVTAP